MVDSSDLDELEHSLKKEVETFATFEDYEKSKNHKETVGDYILGEVIGKGGFATVHKGLNLLTGTVVAVKKFERAKVPSNQISGVMYEVELLKKLNHENIVRIVGKDENDRYLYIFMEFMENGSLSSMTHSFGTFPERLVAEFMEQVLHGLVYLHDEGVVHRDIKAANILLSHDGVKLADFGVAAELNENDRRFSVVGTPYWMAPEVIEITGHSYSSDIWSVGCTVIELVAGKPPYYHLNPMSAMFRIVQDPLPPFPRGISPELEDFLKCCFKKVPTERSTARELLNHKWITQVHETPMVPISMEEIKKQLIAVNGGSGDGEGSESDDSSSDSRDNTIIHSTSSPMSTISTFNSLIDSAIDDESKDVTMVQSSVTSLATVTKECERLRMELDETKMSLEDEKARWRGLVLTAMNYIASADHVAAYPEATQQREFRDNLRSMLEEEFHNAFPDDNVPTFMQRRLTIVDGFDILQETKEKAKLNNSEKENLKDMLRDKEAAKKVDNKKKAANKEKKAKEKVVKTEKLSKASKVVKKDHAKTEKEKEKEKDNKEEKKEKDENRKSLTTSFFGKKRKPPPTPTANTVVLSSPTKV